MTTVQFLYDVFLSVAAIALMRHYQVGASR